MISKIHPSLGCVCGGGAAGERGRVMGKGIGFQDSKDR